MSFGLLTPQDLARAMARDPKMPKSRKLLAVPFVGKDVPSPASEFAHPDVVIGMTVLAFRYEGLRLTDFKLLIHELYDQMADEYGPFAQRPSATKFARWVALAGGRVRRTQKEELLTEVEMEGAELARSVALEEAEQEALAKGAGECRSVQYGPDPARACSTPFAECAKLIQSARALIPSPIF